jgi:hypothetical protein
VTIFFSAPLSASLIVITILFFDTVNLLFDDGPMLLDLLLPLLVGQMNYFSLHFSTCTSRALDSEIFCSSLEIRMAAKII